MSHMKKLLTKSPRNIPTQTCKQQNTDCDIVNIWFKDFSSDQLFVFVIVQLKQQYYTP